MISPNESSGGAAGVHVHFKVQFKDVGPGKLSWEATLKSMDYDTLYREVKKRGGLMSRGIDFDINEETRTGSIFVSLFRCVGTFSWQSGRSAP